MNDFLEIGGKKYISSRRASELTTYKKDYIGQLARAGKIEAKMVGKTWYVCEDSLLEYKNKMVGVVESNFKKIQHQFKPKELDSRPRLHEDKPVRGNDKRENWNNREEERSDEKENGNVSILSSSRMRGSSMDNEINSEELDSRLHGNDREEKRNDDWIPVFTGMTEKTEMTEKKMGMTEGENGNDRETYDLSPKERDACSADISENNLFSYLQNISFKNAGLFAMILFFVFSVYGIQKNGYSKIAGNEVANAFTSVADFSETLSKNTFIKMSLSVNEFENNISSRVSKNYFRTALATEQIIFDTKISATRFYNSILSLRDSAMNIFDKNIYIASVGANSISSGSEKMMKNVASAFSSFDSSLGKIADVYKNIGVKILGAFDFVRNLSFTFGENIDQKIVSLSLFVYDKTSSVGKSVGDSVLATLPVGKKIYDYSSDISSRFGKSVLSLSVTVYDKTISSVSYVGRFYSSSVASLLSAYSSSLASLGLYASSAISLDFNSISSAVSSAISSGVSSGISSSIKIIENANGFSKGIYLGFADKISADISGFVFDVGGVFKTSQNLSHNTYLALASSVLKANDLQSRFTASVYNATKSGADNFVGKIISFKDGYLEMSSLFGKGIADSYISFASLNLDISKQFNNNYQKAIASVSSSYDLVGESFVGSVNAVQSKFLGLVNSAGNFVAYSFGKVYGQIASLFGGIGGGGADTNDKTGEGGNKNSVGIAVLKSTGDKTRDSEMKREIAATFSDEVLVMPDKDGNAGVIKPVFKKDKGDDFIYVIVPIKK